MKLEKAIENLEEEAGFEQEEENWTMVDSIRLGIEGLMRVVNGREKGYDYFAHLLPGETRE